MKYILYGGGHDGVIAMNYLGKENVLCFCDNNKIGGTIEGLPVIGPGTLNDYTSDAVVVIAVSKPLYIAEIARNLSEQNISFVFWQDLAAEIIRKEGKRFSELSERKSFMYDPSKEYIISTDKYNEAGTITSYFWQDLWAARHIYNKKPEMHYDIGSRVDGFITHLLSFGQKVTQIDIRPLDVVVDGYGFICADATNLDGIDDNSIDSLSALCSLEHFGLGRYGDDIDPEACFKCFKAIQRVMRKDGLTYISVPIGKEHLEFNAHRVFCPQTIIEAFDKMSLIEFHSCYGSNMEQNINPHCYDDFDEYGGERYGLFLFQKVICDD